MAWKVVVQARWGGIHGSRSYAQRMGTEMRKATWERVISIIGGKASVFMGKGDRLLIETPGGGAWGVPDSQLKGEWEYPHVYAWEPRGSFAEREAVQAAF